jgi:hypothetical protein
MIFMKTQALFLLASAVLLVGSGCANVKPWQREHLADYTMRADRDPLGTAQAEHIWFSREEASGGRGVGGGGCGCN